MRDLHSFFLDTFCVNLIWGASEMHEKTLPQVHKSGLPYIDRSREMAWVAEHQEEYAGQWVFLDGDRLLAHGDDPLLFKEIARAEGIETPFIVHVPDDTGPSMGGWL
jgi:Family of unknown function (DUF5678)